ADDLIVFVALAGDQNQVAAQSLGDGLLNRLRTICNLAVRLTGLANSLFRVAQDLLRIFRARIIGSQYHDVAQASRSLAHRRALGAVAIAAATKDRNDLPFHNLARR